MGSRVCRLQSLRFMGSKSTGSVVVAYGLSCPTACGISLDQGSNPYPLHCRVDSYPLYHQGSPRTRYIFIFINTLKIFFFFALHPGYVVNYWTGGKKNRWLTLFQKCSCLWNPASPGGSDSKESACKWEAWVQSLGWEDPLKKGMATHSGILPGEFHGQRSLAGCSSWDHKESDTTEWLSTHTLCNRKTVKTRKLKQVLWK